MIRDHQREGEAVVAFAAHRLDGRRAYARLGGEHFVEAPDTLDASIVASHLCPGGFVLAGLAPAQFMTVHSNGKTPSVDALRNVVPSINHSARSPVILFDQMMSVRPSPL